METRLQKFSLFLVAISAIIICFFACTSKPNTQQSAGRILLDPARDTDGQTKILLYYDMEGISGQNVLTSIDFPRKEYFQARELLTNDVNAVIDGLFAGGADVVEVVDAHGSFNPEPDILLDKMDSRAKMVFKEKKFHPYVDIVEEGNYDAIVAVCMHSKTGGGGFAEHTVHLGTDWILNDMSVNESEILAYSWGRAKVPLVFVSGDDKLEEQLSWMDWLEYVTVKKAKGIDDAVLRPVEEVHKELREAAKRAVENIPNSKAIKLTEPIKAQLRVVPPADLSLLEGIPGIDYHDQMITFQAENFKEAYDGIRSFMEIADVGYLVVLQQVFFRQENANELFMQFKDAIFSVWKSAAAGKATSPAAVEKTDKKEPKKKYFGSR